MIALTRTSGEFCALDPAHIQRVEAHPTTVVYLTDGAKYCVTDTVDEVIGKVQRYRAAVMTSAWRLVEPGGARSAASPVTARVTRPV